MVFLISMIMFSAIMIVIFRLTFYHIDKEAIITTIIVSLLFGTMMHFIVYHTPRYDINEINTYYNYKQMIDNGMEVPICIEKTNRGLFVAEQCHNSVIVKNNKELISVINSLYKTDIEEQLKRYKEYNKINEKLNGVKYE